MFKRRTSRVKRRRTATKTLRANVMSPRILWYDFRRTLYLFLKLSFFATLIGGIGYGLWWGVTHGLLENEKFKLKTVTLNQNAAINEIQLLELAEIDPSQSLFHCDPVTIRDRLVALPEIAHASVKRDYPGELVVHVSVRKPIVWVECGSRFPGRDQEKGLLADREGILFSCPPKLYDESEQLPVIKLETNTEDLKAGGMVDHHPEYLRCMRLLQAAENAMQGASSSWIESIALYKSWGCELKTRDGVTAIFGHDDLERQMNDLLAAIEHAKEKGDELATIALVGRKNQPVTFHGERPLRAIIVAPPDFDEESEVSQDE